MIIRIFDTAVDPREVERGKQLFREQVRPAFEKFAGCHGIEMHIGMEEQLHDLVDVVAISRWDSLEAIEQATATEDYSEALAEIRMLFQQTPIIRHLEVVE